MGRTFQMLHIFSTLGTFGKVIGILMSDGDIALQLVNLSFVKKKTPFQSGVGCLMAGHVTHLGN